MKHTKAAAAKTLLLSLNSNKMPKSRLDSGSLFSSSIKCLYKINSSPQSRFLC